MRRLLSHIAVLIAIAAPGEALPSASFSETADLLVVPGHRIGGLELGMKREKMREVLGHAGSEYPAAHKRVQEVWFYDKDGHAEGQIEVQYANGVAVSIGTSLPRSASDDGIVHGSAIAGLNARNAQLRLTTYFVYRSGGVDVKCFDDVRAGIVYEFSKAADALNTYFRSFGYMRAVRRERAVATTTRARASSAAGRWRRERQDSAPACRAAVMLQPMSPDRGDSTANWRSFARPCVCLSDAARRSCPFRSRDHACSRELPF